MAFDMDRTVNTQPGFRTGPKVFLFWVIFLILYGAFKVFPVFPLSIISGINESNFQHYKATFFTLLILNGIEYLAYRKQITDLAAFWYIRLLVGTFAPWMVFLLWYLSPAIYGDKMPSIPLEIIYSNIMTVVAGFYAVTFEKHLGQSNFSPSLKFITVSLFCVSIVLYMVFTFSHLPWADVFVEPVWK